jgi:hypothetical protein
VDYLAHFHLPQDRVMLRRSRRNPRLVIGARAADPSLALRMTITGETGQTFVDTPLVSASWWWCLGRLWVATSPLMPPTDRARG